MINYKIRRFQEQAGIYSIRIESLNNPVYVKYIFTPQESATVETRTSTIERLLAELEIKNEEYTTPPPAVSKLAEIKTYLIRPEKVAEIKTAMDQQVVVQEEIA